MAIPPLDLHGVLPPLRPGVAGSSADRSPYRATILDVAQRFATTAERKVIFRGLLRLRSALRGHGFTSGVQWLDGSFVEDCEGTRSRAPGDIDVVSFVRVASAANARATFEAAKSLVRGPGVKRDFHVDHFVFQLDLPFDEPSVRLVSYWYSMWSHRRGDDRWKGFVQVALDEDDSHASAFVEAGLPSPSGAG